MIFISECFSTCDSRFWSQRLCCLELSKTTVCASRLPIVIRQERERDTAARHSMERPRVVAILAQRRKIQVVKRWFSTHNLIRKVASLSASYTRRLFAKADFNHQIYRQAHLPSRGTTSFDLDKFGGSTLLTSIALGIFILSSANQWLAREMLDWHARWSKLRSEVISQSTLAKGLGGRMRYRRPGFFLTNAA